MLYSCGSGGSGGVAGRRAGGPSPRSGLTRAALFQFREPRAVNPSACAAPPGTLAKLARLFNCFLREAPCVCPSFLARNSKGSQNSVPSHPYGSRTLSVRSVPMALQQTGILLYANSSCPPRCEVAVPAPPPGADLQPAAFAALLPDVPPGEPPWCPSLPSLVQGRW